MNNYSPCKLQLITESGSRLSTVTIPGKQGVYWFKQTGKRNTHLGDAAMENEIAAYTAAQKHGIPNLLPCTAYSIEGTAGLVLPEARGVSLLSSKLNKTQFDLVKEAVFHFIKCLSNIKSDKFGSLEPGGPRFDTEDELMLHMYRIRSTGIKTQCPQIPGLLESVFRLCRHNEKPALVHYDLWPGNIFFDSETGCVVIIDLERALYAGPWAEGASLLGFIDYETIVHELCNGKLEAIARMYAYRILFLLERLDDLREPNGREELQKDLFQVIACLVKQLNSMEVRHE